MEGGEAETSSEQGRTSPSGGVGGGGGGGDICRQNGLINTHRLGTEPREALLLVYSAPQYQSHVVVNAPPQQERNSGRGGGGPPQLLNPSALLPQQAVTDPRFRPPPSLFLCPESVLRAWGEAGGGDCCETTFIEELSPDASSSSDAAAASSTKEALLFADGKFLEFSGEETKIHTLSYDIDEDDDFQELEVMTSCFIYEGFRVKRESHRHTQNVIISI